MLAAEDSQIVRVNEFFFSRKKASRRGPGKLSRFRLPLTDATLETPFADRANLPDESKKVKYYGDLA
jgi:hypothetical protein